MNVVSIRVVPILKKIEKGQPYFFMDFIKMITLKRVMTYYEKVFLLLSYRTYARSLWCKMHFNLNRKISAKMKSNSSYHSLLTLAFCFLFFNHCWKSLEKFFQGGKRIFSSFWESLRLSEPSSANNRPNESWWLQNNARRLKFYLCTLVG